MDRWIDGQRTQDRWMDREQRIDRLRTEDGWMDRWTEENLLGTNSHQRGAMVREHDGNPKSALCFPRVF
jgi:hypothetical protein